MKFQGAVVKERGVKFAVVIVKKSVFDNSFERDKALASFRPYFPGLPVLLMAQDFSGNPSYYGRPDISSFLASVPLGAIPWKEYSVG